MPAPKTRATRVTLSRAGTPKVWTAAAISLVFGVAAVVGFFLGSASLGVLLAGIVLAGLGALVVALAVGPADWVQLTGDSISQWHGRQQLWQLRWQHLAAVRFAPEVVLLVPVDGVADHPEIAPALTPHRIDGLERATFELQIGPAGKTQEAVRAAITQHAPPGLLAQSSPRPPST